MSENLDAIRFRSELVKHRNQIAALHDLTGSALNDVNYLLLLVNRLTEGETESIEVAPPTEGEGDDA